MSEQALVRIGQEQLQQGGVGLDFGSKLFDLKPATININQPTTQVEGAIRGNLRISETGDQFKEMWVTLLKMPTEQRKFYEGEKGQLNRSFDNLMCFSRDMKRPDQKAKVPQAMQCGCFIEGRWTDTCPKASWAPWREKKEATGIKDPTLIPPCDAEYYALFIDTVYKMPLQMFIRSKSKAPFEKGMKELARKFKLMQSQGLNPNIFDIRFRLSTEAVKNAGGTTTYVLKLDEFKAITDLEREAFGEVYLQYINRGKQTAEQSAENEQAEAVAEAEYVIDAAVSSPTPAPVAESIQDGEIII